MALLKALLPTMVLVVMPRRVPSALCPPACPSSSCAISRAPCSMRALSVPSREAVATTVSRVRLRMSAMPFPAFSRGAVMVCAIAVKSANSPGSAAASLRMSAMRLFACSSPPWNDPAAPIMLKMVAKPISVSSSRALMSTRPVFTAASPPAAAREAPTAANCAALVTRPSNAAPAFPAALAMLPNAPAMPEARPSGLPAIW